MRSWLPLAFLGGFWWDVRPELALTCAMLAGENQSRLRLLGPASARCRSHDEGSSLS